MPDSLTIDVGCISETRIHDSSSVIQLAVPDISGRVVLDASRDEAVCDPGQCGVKIALTDKVKRLSQTGSR